MKYCPECGKEVEDNWEHCPNCGFNLYKYNDRSSDASESSYSQYDPNTPVSYYSQSTNSFKTTSSEYEPNKPPTHYRSPTHQRSDTNTFGIISIIFAIIGCFICGIPLGILAIIIGIVGTRQDHTGGTATFGIVLGVIDFCCALMLLIGFSPLFF
jgi:hypothetical protein